MLYTPTVVAIFVAFIEVSRDSIREKQNFSILLNLVFRVPLQSCELVSFIAQKGNLKKWGFVLFNPSW